MLCDVNNKKKAIEDEGYRYLYMKEGISEEYRLFLQHKYGSRVGCPFSSSSCKVISQKAEREASCTSTSSQTFNGR